MAVSEEMISIDQGPVNDAKLSPTGMEIPMSTTYEQWAAMGRKLAIHHEASNFWIGDWLCTGEARWGEKYAQAASETGIGPERLRQLKFVSSRIPKSIRNSYLHWSHHRVVAVAELEDEDRAVWLAKAIQHEWTSHELEKQIRGLPEPEHKESNGELIARGGRMTQTGELLTDWEVRGKVAIDPVDPVKTELCSICGHSGGVLQPVCGTCIESKPVTMPTKVRELLKWAFNNLSLPDSFRQIASTSDKKWQGMYAALKRAAEGKRGRPKKR